MSEETNQQPNENANAGNKPSATQSDVIGNLEAQRMAKENDELEREIDRREKLRARLQSAFAGQPIKTPEEINKEQMQKEIQRRVKDILV